MQDKALIGSLTNIVRIRDPDNSKLVIASIRDPKVDINPYSSMNGVINMVGAIESGTVPVFNGEVPPMTFDIRSLGWYTMLDLIKIDKNDESKKKNAQFWEFIDRLRVVRQTYN